MIAPLCNLSSPTTLHALRRLLGVGVFVATAWVTHGYGQLTWSSGGTGGTGGSGTWDPATTVDWWNGSANVTWSSGSSAIFAGTGGTVGSVFPGPVVSDLTFDSPGYTIQSGWLNAAGATMNIVTNEAATISSTLSPANGGTTLVKSGSAALTVSGTNFMTAVQVNQGEYIVGGTSSLFFSDVTLADSAGATVTLGRTSANVAIGSLSGGGLSGGVLQPDAQARTVIATLNGSGVFNGVAQDNGSGILALTVSGGLNTTVTFGGANTYSGATLINNGTLALNQNGSLLNSAVTVHSGSVLQLDNSTTVVADRLSDTQVLTMQNGQLNFIGNSMTAVEEQAGNLQFAGANEIRNTQPGSAASLLTFASATRAHHGTIDFSGNGRTKWNGMANDATGIVGAYATVGSEWATVGGDGRVDALTTYASDINAAGAGDHVKITGGGTTALSTSVTRATLNLQNSSGTAGMLNLGSGNVLTLSDGGILSSGSATSQIQGGTLSIGSSELVVTNQNALTISSPITEGSTPAHLTKSGAGVLTLSGTNHYSGVTTINQGTLIVSSDASLGTGTAIELDGGTLQAGQSFSSSKNITQGTTLVGTIDTAGFNVTFTGSNGGGFNKTGAGTLTLTNPAPGTVYVEQGTLALANNLISGTANLQGGTLQAAGSLASMSLNLTSSLDIGGATAATLTVQNLSSIAAASSVTVRFGLGLSASDLWTIVSPILNSGISDDTFLFDFQNLGGVAVGSNYTIMDVKSSGLPLTASMFGLAPAATAAGWNGTFAVTSNAVTFHVTATPEPDSVLLLGLGVLGLCGRRRSRR